MINNFFIAKLPIISLVIGLAGIIGLGVAIYHSAFVYVLPAGFLGFVFLSVSGISWSVRRSLYKHINRK